MSRFTDKWIDDHKDGLVEDLRAALRFASLEGAAEPGKPFGPVVADCLENVLATGAKLGLAPKNCENYVGCLDAGAGDELLGILAHLDVVPAGGSWDHPAFGAEIHDGRIYARGAVDDKGPALAAIYALAAVKASGAEFRRRVRIILGCNEETNMGCLKYYLANEEIPALSFSPDSEYPLTNSEKTILHFTVEKKYASGVSAAAGEAANIVPDYAEALVKTAGSGVKKLAAKGVTAHGSLPADGVNAMLKLFEEMQTVDGIAPEDKAVADALLAAFGGGCNGERLGLDYSDYSGRQTVNPGVLRWNAEGVKLTVDMRCPTSQKEEVLRAAIEKALPGFEIVKWDFRPGYSIPEDAEIVTKLLKVFRDRTGLTDAQPKQIGGGTYARELPNAVSFGPEGYMCESGVHVANEFIGIDQLVMNCKMLADAIEALAL